MAEINPIAATPPVKRDEKTKVKRDQDSDQAGARSERQQDPEPPADKASHIDEYV